MRKEKKNKTQVNTNAPYTKLFLFQKGFHISLQMHICIGNISSEFNILFDSGFSDGVIHRRGMSGSDLCWVLFSLPLLHYQADNDTSAKSSHC